MEKRIIENGEEIKKSISKLLEKRKKQEKRREILLDSAVYQTVDEARLI